jgi:2-oxoglutarate dehydrogenase E1 component
MDELTRHFHGPNAAWVEELYERYLADPESVDAASRALFASLPHREAEPPAAAGVCSDADAFSDQNVSLVVRVARIARFIRELGHLDARLDPLGSPPPSDPGLALEYHGLTESDLRRLPASLIDSSLAHGAANALEAVGRLREVYSGPIGYEDAQVQSHEERRWLREAVETDLFFRGISDDDRRALLFSLTEVECFERFLHQTYVGQKRFSLEGTDMLVPMLETMIRDAAGAGIREVLMGMAHRGRLNVLAHILDKPYSVIFREFESPEEDPAAVSGGGTRGWAGDVKYHLGHRRSIIGAGEGELTVQLASNPSHLEFVNPVVVGQARAAQEQRDSAGAPRQDLRASLAILIHGDAAFPGQGVVAETLNMSRLPGYQVGGSIHIITNNQIGFTTEPVDSRSTLYAGDLAKGFEIPIIHVNADDPIACVAAARLAFAYLKEFGRDILVDLVGYRRWGHNEGDEPAFTNPRLYDAIRSHPTVRALFAREMERDGVIKPGEAEAMEQRVMEALQKARTAAPPELPAPPPPKTRPVSPLPLTPDRLLRLNEALLTRPDGFEANPKLERTLQRRRTAVEDVGGIEWAHAESLAFATILEDGTPIRLTGQDSERGTFSQRHLVLHDSRTGARFCPLQNLPQAKASFAVHNSPLSETAALGFEYGYSRQAAEALVLWEAQFGDFANGAQVIIDQFLVSGRAKWKHETSLVLLLPHGYEGQGPEHSSARIERFLQLAADGNVRIANPTTAGQYFHLLRRQAAMLTREPRPLIVFTPKSLLRHPRAGSSLEELVSGEFQSVLDDAAASREPERVRRIVFCSGKVYVDLVMSRSWAETEGVAVVRVEELYPFPSERLSEIIARYTNATDAVWMQEEPRNMGAWTYVAPRLMPLLAPRMPLRYVGRAESASTAEGSLRQHTIEQARIVTEALRGVPATPSSVEDGSIKTEVAHAR